jgi:16S rRNA A1518/A1519 N6-dimethyltransferase RsmA/KsgA/DIM1 with predicted DNA glycosylase/AP lyase activity
MDPKAVRKKFGDDYIADAHTFKMGIDRRFTEHFAKRFKNMTVLETCTGAGFTTISLAKYASHVYTVEINQSHQKQAKANVEKSKLSDRVTFIRGDILDRSILNNLPHLEGAFIDPDWADEDPHHTYRFLNSNTNPPADILLKYIFKITENIALVLAPYIDINEFKELPKHECESLYMDNRHELFCLYFGKLIKETGMTEFYSQ